MAGEYHDISDMLGLPCDTTWTWCAGRWVGEEYHDISDILLYYVGTSVRHDMDFNPLTAKWACTLCADKNKFLKLVCYLSLSLESMCQT